VLSQIDVHQKFGGVVPEVAARHHLESINQIIDQALSESHLAPQELAGIAFTQGPGLIGTLLTGASAAKAYAWAYDLPLVAVDHLLAHVCANYIDSDLEPPFIALLVSGGHTQIIHFDSFEQGTIIGQTIDDASGEAYDKVARLLGLGYPGGPVIDKLAQDGNPRAFAFPEGVVAGYNFSFSGLKTAVLRTVEKLPKPLPQADLAASFQEAVTRVLVKKTIAACKEFNAPSIVLAGGVAANKTLRKKFEELAPVRVYSPPIRYCTDNAAMVGAAAYYCGKPVDYGAAVYSRLRLRD
jgi:N6-L-threonylcarbamoyladenine synthase